MATSSKNILVTGGNKGIGLEVCRQLARAGHQVTLSARSEERGREAVEALSRENISVAFLHLDTSDEASIRAAAQELGSRIDALHVLVNNAAILNKWQGSILDATGDDLRETFATNTTGPILLTLALLPLLEAARPSQVINVSSELGSIATMTDGWASYGISKAALNAATRKLAVALKPRGVSVISASPGWVRTDMGGKGANLSVEQGGQNIVRHILETEPSTNQFIGSKGTIPW